MNYNQKLTKVIDYIGEHLDEDLSLDKLSDIFCISKFHFHRIFTAFTGLSLQQYIRWLRLKRAAYQLIFDKKQSIINVAMNAGFESHEAFSRAFKKECGINPSECRESRDISYWQKSPYSLPKDEVTPMKVEIRNINKKRLAVVEHRGDFRLIAGSLNKLISWAKAQTLDLGPKAGETFGFAYDDPNKTPPDQFRMDFGIKIPENLKIQSDVIIEKYIPAGRYAVVMHKGTRNKIADTIYPIYREWLPKSGEEFGDLPCVFCYYNFDHEVAETEALTECWFLLK